MGIGALLLDSFTTFLTVAGALFLFSFVFLLFLDRIIRVFVILTANSRASSPGLRLSSSSDSFISSWDRSKEVNLSQSITNSSAYAKRESSILETLFISSSYKKFAVIGKFIDNVQFLTFIRGFMARQLSTTPCWKIKIRLSILFLYNKYSIYFGSYEHSRGKVH